MSDQDGTRGQKRFSVTVQVEDEPCGFYFSNLLRSFVHTTKNEKTKKFNLIDNLHKIGLYLIPILDGL